LAPFVRPLARMMAGPGERVTARLFHGSGGILMLTLGLMLPHVVILYTLDPLFPTTHALVDDWAQHAHNVLLLMTGFLLAKDRNFWNAVHRALPLVLTLAIALG